MTWSLLPDQEPHPPEPLTARDDPARDDPARDDPARDDPAHGDPARDDPARDDLAYDDLPREDPVYDELPAASVTDDFEGEDFGAEGPTAEDHVSDSPVTEGITGDASGRGGAGLDERAVDVAIQGAPGGGPERAAGSTGTEAQARARPGGVVGFEVRTAYSSRLNGLARSWPPPAGGLFLDGARLRLWVAAAGAPGHGGYVLGMGALADQDRDTVGAALSRAGLASVLSDDGLGFVITGRKRLSRLAELVGDRPAAAPAALWPGGTTS
ncbi:hypothetical protein [Krasilnikovia sp. MM14-A1004]|uniref:hypothetical protein n=1 Tax=Krasilnikovia sp. MM14-A1004 TaxID=3373541 RepID=UPI00399C6A66